MSLLIDPAPLSVSIGGREWGIHADFRTSILFEQLLLDNAITEETVVQLALNLYFPTLPDDINEAAKQMVSFFRCGKTPRKAKTTGQSSGNQRRLYDYEQDDALIYAAFRADYGIDLEAVDFLHWWKFKAMFDGLRPDNAICKIMEYRGADTKRMKGEQRTFYARMQRLYALQRPQEETERADALSEVLMAGGDVVSVLYSNFTKD